MSERASRALEEWGAWCRASDTLWVVGMRRHPTGTLGRMVRIARSGGEIWLHNEPEDRDFDEPLMESVNAVILSLDGGLRRVADARWRDGRLTERQAARKLGLSRSTYQRRVKEIVGAVESGATWR